MMSRTSGTVKCPWMSITLMRRRPTNTSRRAAGGWIKNPAAAPTLVLTNDLRVSTANPFSWRDRSQVRRQRENVVVGQLRDRFLHQLRIDTVSSAVLEQIQLARDVDRVQAGEPRNVAEAFHRVAVTDAAGDGPAGSAALDERLALRDAPFRHVRDEARMRIAAPRSLDI